MKHTPGPWKIGKSETSEPAIKNRQGDCVAVACELIEGEAQANAHLIEELGTMESEEIIDRQEYYVPSNEVLHKLQQAINRAEKGEKYANGI